MSGTYEVDASDLIRLSTNAKLFPKEASKAMSKALNKTLNRVVTTTTKEVNKEYSPLRKGINSALTKKRASWTRLQAEAIYTDRQLKASGFRKKIPTNQYRAPVSLKIKKAMKESSGNPVMFGGRGRSEVFKRELGQRGIQTVYTLSIPQMVSNEDVYKSIAEDAERYLSDTFMHELEWRVSQIMD